MPKGARNPKTARMTLAIDDNLNTRLERVADAAGQNKGTMAAFVLAAGLRIVEEIMLPADPEKSAEIVRHVVRRHEEDLNAAAERAKKDIGFKPKAEEDLSAWVPSQGYMAGL